MPAPATHTTTNAIAKALSTVETVTGPDEAATLGRAGVVAEVPVLDTTPGRLGLPPETRLAAAPAVGGVGALETPMAAGAAGAADAIGAAVAAEGGAACGKVGSLMVGAAVGLGGKLMRTVSFFGWTLALSAGLGGSAPGKLGMFSDIGFSSSQN